MPEEIVTLQSSADWACEKVDAVSRPALHSANLMIRTLNKTVDCRIACRILSPFDSRRTTSVQTMYRQQIDPY